MRWASEVGPRQVWVVEQNLSHDELSHVVLSDALHVLEAEVDCAAFVHSLLRLHSQLAQVRTGQRLLGRQPLVRVEGEQLSEQLQCARVGARVALCEVDGGPLLLRAEVVLGLVVLYLADVAVCGSAQHVEDDIQLVQLVRVRQRIVGGERKALQAHNRE